VLRLVTAATWLLVITFACVPAFSRVHDRLSAADQAGGFRFSKNVERPHQKHVATGRVAFGVLPELRLDPVEWLEPGSVHFIASSSLVLPPLRGPPRVFPESLV